MHNSGSRSLLGGSHAQAPHLPQRSRRPASSGQARRDEQRRIRTDSAGRRPPPRQRDGDARGDAARARPRLVAARIPGLRRGHGDRAARDERRVRRGGQHRRLLRDRGRTLRRTRSSRRRSSIAAASSSTCRGTSSIRAGSGSRTRRNEDRDSSAFRAPRAAAKRSSRISAPSSSSRTCSSIRRPTAWCSRSFRARSPPSR